MIANIVEGLASKSKNIFSVSELEELSTQIENLFASSELTDSDYNDLMRIINRQLKLILDLNLLPSYDFIAIQIEKNNLKTLEKVDSGEILSEEFEIIEQEAIQINLARIKFIQAGFEEYYQSHAHPKSAPYFQENMINKIFKYITTFLKK